MIKAHPQGTVLQLYIQPGASRTEMAGVYDDAVKIRIQAPPVDGKANKALIRYLSKTFGISGSRVIILKGETGRKKLILLEGLPLKGVQAMLSGYLPT